MAKHPLSLHLSDARKNRLDALISHSEYEGHGAQSDFLRTLIDQAAADHPEIEYDDPKKAIDPDETEYRPLDYDGLLNQEQVREILNSEKAPAINPEHCPPTWEPRDKSDKAVLMAAHFRYHRLLEVSDPEARSKAIENVVGMISSKEKEDDYRDRLDQVLNTYGEKPSNLLFFEQVAIPVWIMNIGELADKEELPEHMLSEHIQVGKKLRQKAKDVNDDQLAEDVEQVINELRRQE